MKYDLTVIGRVRREKGLFEIVVDEPFRDGLEGLEGFSHLQIFWWAHQADREERRRELLLEKPYVKGPERIGVFATRSPGRPNPLALTAAPVIDINKEEGVIVLPYLDAEPGSPVVDIKPYHPSSERVREARVPGWCAHWPACYEESGDFDWEKEFAF